MSGLTREAEQHIDKYLFRKLVPTGFFAALLGFLAGSLVETRVMDRVISDLTGPVMAASIAATEAKVQADEAYKSVQEDRETIANLLDQAKADRVQSSEDNAASKKVLEEALSKRDEAIALLSASETAKSVASELGRNKDFVAAVRLNLTRDYVKWGDQVDILNKGTNLCLEDPDGTHIPSLQKCRGSKDSANVQTWIFGRR